MKIDRAVGLSAFVVEFFLGFALESDHSCPTQGSKPTGSNFVIVTSLLQIAVQPRARKQLAAAALLGVALGGLAYWTIWAFEAGFRVSATWSLVTGSGGPGVLFILVPVAAAWLLLARNEQSYWRVLVLSAIAATIAYALARAWLEVDGFFTEITSSLLTTMSVSMLVGGVGAVAVRGVLDSIESENPGGGEPPGHS